MTPSTDGRFAPAPDVQARRFNDEVVIVDLVGGEFFALDEVGTKVWEGLAAGARVSEVVANLGASYDADVARIETDVLALVGELTSRRLLVERSP